MNRIIGIIPARMGSSRFPGKPMKEILGMPMIGHVYNRSRLCSVLDELWVATCDKEIHKYITNIGGLSIMTSKDHKRASDRVSEALLLIEKAKKNKFDIIVMIQGDEPLITPDMIEKSIEPMTNNKNINIVNLMANIKRIKEFNDPNTIKVVVDNNDFALYFSREPIPSKVYYKSKFKMLKQVCVIPFRRDFLLKYNSLKESTLEKIESIDMNRILENGMEIKMVSINELVHAVDTKEDLSKVEKIILKDKLFLEKKY